MRSLGPALAMLWLAGALRGQEVQRRSGDYNVVNSLEFGHRSAFVTGNEEVYRSAVNYRNGWRVFDGFVRAHSRDGHGRFFDELVLTTFGSGGDPYQANSLRLEKNRLYRLDLGFRITNYYNHLLQLSGGQHRFNTERIFQNYDLTLFPTRRVQFVFGFDRNNWNGPGLTTEHFDVSREPAFPRDRFFVFANHVRRLNNTWRYGVDFQLAGLKFSALQGWDYFKDDTTNFPAFPTDLGTGLGAAGFRRSDPVHGRTPFSRLNVQSDANRRLAVNGRFIYAGGRRRFALDENIANANPVSGVLVTRQSFVLGDAERTQATGDLTVTLQPGQRWTFSNMTSVHQTRITGDSTFVETRAPASGFDPGFDQASFSYLATRHVTNTTDANLQVHRVAGLYGGYRVSARRIQSRDARQEAGGPLFESPLYSFDNTTHSVLGGVRLRPLKPLTLAGDAEYGRADRPFVAVAEQRYHNESARVQWRTRTLQVTGAFRYYRNENTGPVLAAGAVSGGLLPNYLQLNRNYSVGAAWTPPRRFALDANYAKLHLETSAPILNFPVPGAAGAGGRSALYLSNIHQLRAGLRYDYFGVVLYLGYALVKDTGDGRAALNSAPGAGLSYPGFAFDGANLRNVYPLSHQAPQARVTVFLLRQRLSWNGHWQYYAFRERFTNVQNYHAHLFTTSFRLGF